LEGAFDRRVSVCIVVFRRQRLEGPSNNIGNKLTITKIESAGSKDYKFTFSIFDKLEPEKSRVEYGGYMVEDIPVLYSRLIPILSQFKYTWCIPWNECIRTVKSLKQALQTFVLPYPSLLIQLR
jgi:hypothetical protein